MAPLLSWCSSPSDEPLVGTPLVLNVYDLTPANNCMYWFGLGMFHSGIEAYGFEYGFGAHDYPTSGVFEVEPRSCPGFIYRCSIPLGRINMHLSKFREFMENMSDEYHGDTYHLLLKNCNHFTEDACLRLTGKQIPGWINRLAHLGNICSCVLPESLPLSTTTKPRSKYHTASEDVSGSFSLLSALDRLGSESSDRDRHIFSPSSSDGEAAFIQVKSSSA